MRPQGETSPSLISSGSNGKTVVNYTYDKNGNLLSKESSLKSEKYIYNAQNRLCESVVIDRQNKTQAVSYYGYDAFGRRVVVQDRDAACMRSLYDGFTFDVIKQSPTLANGMFVDSNETGLRLNRTGKATGDRYRYLDDDKNDGNRYFYLDEGTYKSVTSRYVGERTSIAVNGVVAGQNAGGEVSYFTTDLLGSVRTTTDSAGFGTNTYTYDVFGSLVEGDLSGATDYGYLGKQFDPQTGLYNYGYRDYAPIVARFTTVDPICDGNNWFSYVNNDPVNFVDLWGLSASDATSAIPGSELDFSNYKYYTVFGADGQILGVGAEGDARKAAIENAPKLTVGVTLDLSIGVASGSVGLTASSNGTNTTGKPVANASVGVNNPSIGATASIGVELPGNKGTQEHTISVNIFGVGGSVSFSENGVTKASITVSSSPKIDVDSGDMGIAYEVFSY